MTAQVALLERRGLSFADKGRAEEFLLRENYYAVVNGYKDAFIDRQATNLALDDRYAQGTSFEDLMLECLATWPAGARAWSQRCSPGWEWPALT